MKTKHNLKVSCPLSIKNQSIIYYIRILIKIHGLLFSS